MKVRCELEIARLLSKKLNEYKDHFSAFPTDMEDEQFIEQEFTDEFYQALHIKDWRELLDGPRRVDVQKRHGGPWNLRHPLEKSNSFPNRLWIINFLPLGWG